MHLYIGESKHTYFWVRGILGKWKRVQKQERKRIFNVSFNYLSFHSGTLAINILTPKHALITVMC